MDVNGTRFHLVLGRDDWAAPGMDPRASWNDDGHLELRPLAFVFPRRTQEEPPRITDRRGAGRDRFGTWYWISADGHGIDSRSHHDAEPVPFWPHPQAEPAPPVARAGDFAPVDPAPPLRVRLQGLAVTGEHYLVAGTPDEPGLLVWDLAAGGPPVALRWPDGVPFAPWDICAAPDGGVWLLDRDNARLWSLDRLFRVREVLPSPLPPREPDFERAGSVEGEAEDDGMREGPVTLQASVDASSVIDPCAVEALCDGGALVLGRDAEGPVLHRFTLRDGQTAVRPLAPVIAAYEGVAGVLKHAHEFAYLPGPGCGADAIDGTAFLVAPDGNQSFAFALSGGPGAMEARLNPPFYPMRRFGGRALVVAGGEAHYDSGTRWVSLLEYPRPIFERETVIQLPARGTEDTRVPGAPGSPPAYAWDGREPGCVWHRLFLDGCIPPEASVTVESRASDTLDGLNAMPWSVEPTPYLRGGGAEIPWRGVSSGGAGGDAGTWELLFQQAVGRYLQLRLTLRGNGRVTPRIRSLRAWYPRFSYLREYLPAVYREDGASASFLDRFLGNVEGTLTEVEDRIAAAQMLFAPGTVPPEFLDWLAGWMGAALDASWSERKKRWFLSHAMEMFAGRGTRDGLIRSLRLALEDCIDPAMFPASAGTAAIGLSSAGFGGSGSSSLVGGSSSSRGFGGSSAGLIGSMPGGSASTGSGSTGAGSSGSGLMGSISAGSPSTGNGGSKGDCGCGCGGASSSTGAGDGGRARFTVRVVERFLSRDRPGVAYGDVGDLAGPGTTTTALAWTPAQGPEPLHARWREWLAGRYADIDALNKAWGLSPAPAMKPGVTAEKAPGQAAGRGEKPRGKMPVTRVRATLPGRAALALAAAEPTYASFSDARLRLPATAPKQAVKAADWTAFLREGLGFTWIVPDAGGDLALWRDTLARRYRQPGDLNRAWGLTGAAAWTSFDAVAYPAELPQNRAALSDWITFVSVVVPMRRGAHRFTVLVPVAPGDDQETQRRRRDLARRIAMLEKPAHTVVDTRLYWAAFRVGEARLGTDTLLGQGSRFTALVLDRGELAASHLGWTEPWNVRGRMVVGRDPVAARPSSRGTTQRWT